MVKTRDPDRWEAFPDEHMAKQVMTDIKVNLTYGFHPLFDWRPFPSQRLATLQIDQFGLRTNPLKAGRPVVLFLGGSFAWGYGAASNDSTPWALLERRLELAGLDVSVFNLSDQNYTSWQEIKAFCSAVIDLPIVAVVSVSGFNDISNAVRGLFKLHNRYRDIVRFFQWGVMNGLVKQPSPLRLLKRMALGRLRPPPASGDVEVAWVEAPEPEERPLQVYGHKVDIVGGYCRQRGIPMIWVLQPSAFSKNPKSRTETAILDEMRIERADFYRRQFELFKAQFKIWADESCSTEHFIDATSAFDNVAQTIFFDSAHVSDAGYALFVDHVFDEIKAVIEDALAAKTQPVGCGA